MNIKKTLIIALVISSLALFAMAALVFTARDYIRSENKYFEKHFQPFTYRLIPML